MLDIVCLPIEVWAAGAELIRAARAVPEASIDIDRHALEHVTLAGYTSADPVVVDRTNGVRVSGDIAFRDRTPTLPHTNIVAWQPALERLESLP